MGRSALPRGATDAPIQTSPGTRKSPDHAVRALPRGGGRELRPAASATVTGRVRLAGVGLGGLSGCAIGLTLGAGSRLLGLALFLGGQLCGIGLFLDGCLLSCLFG